MSVSEKKNLCVQVEKRHGEYCRKLLREYGLVDLNLKIAADEEVVCLPLNEEITVGDKNEKRSFFTERLDHVLSLTPEGSGVLSFPFKIEECCFESKKKTVGDWRSRLVADECFDPELLDYLPSSFDIVGHILLIKLDKELLPSKEIIGEALVNDFKHVRTVALEEKVEGEFRIRKLTHLAGDHVFETVHRENGLHYELNPTKVYFSPRLATERMRVVDAINERMNETGRSEDVFDMFAGVGPFSLLIAKRTGVVRVVAVDKNPYAIGYLKRNMERGHITSVEPHPGDAAERAGFFAGTGEKFQRIIMNLPSHPDPFFGPALEVLDTDSIVHFYRITEQSETEKVKRYLTNTASSGKRTISDIGVRVVHSYSATSSLYAFDVLVE